MIRLNEVALSVLLESPTGPVGRDMLRRAENVADIARLKASGDVIGIRSTDLFTGIDARVEATVNGPIGTVSTDAMSDWHGRPFSYPAWHDQNGRPWLTDALRDGFDL